MSPDELRYIALLIRVRNDPVAEPAIVNDPIADPMELPELVPEETVTIICHDIHCTHADKEQDQGDVGAVGTDHDGHCLDVIDIHQNRV
jgi:hypothetical protein